MNGLVKWAWFIVLAVLFCGSDIFIFLGIGVVIGLFLWFIGPEKFEKF